MSLEFLLNWFNSLNKIRIFFFAICFLYQFSEKRGYPSVRLHPPVAGAQPSWSRGALVLRRAPIHLVLFSENKAMNDSSQTLRCRSWLCLTLSQSPVFFFSFYICCLVFADIKEEYFGQENKNVWLTCGAGFFSALAAGGGQFVKFSKSLRESLTIQKKWCRRDPWNWNFLPKLFQEPLDGAG